MKAEVVMTHKKSTKHTEVYENSELLTPITSLYISKSAFTSTVPKVVKITIEDVNA